MDISKMYKIGFISIGLVLVLYGIIYADICFDFIKNIDIYNYIAPVTLILSGITLCIGLFSLISKNPAISAATYIVIAIPFFLSSLMTYVSLGKIVDIMTYIYIAAAIIVVVLALLNGVKRQSMGMLASLLAAAYLIVLAIPKFINAEYFVYIIMVFALASGILFLFLGIMDRQTEVIPE